VRRRTSNDPLGACVRLEPRQKTLPLRFRRMFHLWPTRFWSTSNSTSMRPFSGLSFSFQSDAAVQEPRRMTSPSLALAPMGAATRAVATTTLVMSAAARLARILCIRVVLSGCGGPALAAAG
jgi:hypothetical protein